MHKPKTYTVFAGVNGAGKSTFHRVLKRDFGIRINVDEIIREQFNNDWSNPQIQMNAGRIAIRLINESLKGDTSFNQETTLTGRTIITNIKKAKANGFEVVLYYVGLESVGLSIERVAIRVANGGHGIPVEDLQRRYSNSFENLKLVMPLCDKVYIYDNSTDNTRGGFNPLIIIQNGKVVLLDKGCPQYLKDVLDVLP
ncbi:MAG: zeta toxin family protein [Defluviitaleaceae bacterium]|nr:zeta toxin family protein [Defluviitaleaceae bacterium]